LFKFAAPAPFALRSTSVSKHEQLHSPFATALVGFLRANGY